MRSRVATPLKLQVTPGLEVQEEIQKAELAKSLSPTAEWMFLESLNIAKTNSILLDFGIFCIGLIAFGRLDGL